MLFPFIIKFKNAKNEKGRKTVIENAVDAVRKSKNLLELEDDLPKDLPTVCICYFVYIFRLICKPLGDKKLR